MKLAAATTFKQLNKNIDIAVIPFAGHLVHNDQPKIYSNILSNFHTERAKVASRI